MIAMDGSERSPACVLEERHMVSALLYLSDHDGCTKTQLYNAVSSNPRMPEKLDRLAMAGLVLLESPEDSRVVRVSLTPVGREVCGKLADIDSAMSV